MEEEAKKIYGVLFKLGNFYFTRQFFELEDSLFINELRKHKMYNFQVGEFNYLLSLWLEKMKPDETAKYSITFNLDRRGFYIPFIHGNDLIKLVDELRKHQIDRYSIAIWEGEPQLARSIPLEEVKKDVGLEGKANSGISTG